MTQNDPFQNNNDFSIYEDIIFLNENLIDPFSFGGTEYTTLGTDEEGIKKEKNESNETSLVDKTSDLSLKSTPCNFARKISAKNLSPVIISTRTGLNPNPYPLGSMTRKTSQSSILVSEPLRKPSNPDLNKALESQLQKNRLNSIDTINTINSINSINTKSPNQILEKQFEPEIQGFNQVEEHFAFNPVLINKLTSQKEIDVYSPTLIQRKSNILFRPTNSLISVLDTQMNNTDLKGNNIDSDYEEEDEVMDLPQGNLDNDELDKFLGLEDVNKVKEPTNNKKETLGSSKNQIIEENVMKEENEMIEEKVIIEEKEKEKERRKEKEKNEEKDKVINNKEKKTDKEWKTNQPINRNKTKKKKTQSKIKINQKKKNNNNKFENKRTKESSEHEEEKRKRELTIENSKTKSTSKKTSKNLDSTVVEAGKDVFKLMVGQLWVIMGGGTIKALKPYTLIFAEKIGDVFSANESEVQIIKNQLKYLLSNSRRTFTEFILEIFIGVLSLIYGDSIPQITHKFWNVLEELCEQNIVKSDEEDNEKEEIKVEDPNNNNNNNNNSNDSNDNKTKIEREPNREKQSNGPDPISIKLEQIYEEIYPQHVLMYWFNKRFSERLGQYFPTKQQKIFYQQHLFYLGKSKFLLSCMLLAKEMIFRRKELESYFNLISRSYDEDPLNLYFHNRGEKLKIIKVLISEFGLNNGDYWSIISNDYISRIGFKPKNSLEHFPFQNLINNPKILNLCQGKTTEVPKKSRKKTYQLKELEVPFKTDWLLKKKLN
ncbi:transcription initiation factor tfiid subunit 3 [Anaeramoeba flamelloides]|uniref:Transcription initiation factor tfiid subunit 3 n=1 Tax=Anaeramoeba flamelloides TaxID=1746091 RepID=A0ABQ8XVA0_9EUKA|nr:transcription initiation factor tfiid subunit 3 [Anaeramoeba flamelloides]